MQLPSEHIGSQTTRISTAAAAACVQSASDDRATAVAARIEAGMVYVNGAGEDPQAPFGGYKMSGNGRERGDIAFGDFLETKAVIHREAA